VTRIRHVYVDERRSWRDGKVLTTECRGGDRRLVAGPRERSDRHQRDGPASHRERSPRRVYGTRSSGASDRRGGDVSVVNPGTGEIHWRCPTIIRREQRLCGFDHGSSEIPWIETKPARPVDHGHGGGPGVRPLGVLMKWKKGGGDYVRAAAQDCRLHCSCCRASCRLTRQRLRTGDFLPEVERHGDGATTALEDTE